MVRSLPIDQQKVLLFLFMMVVLAVGMAVALNRIPFIRLKSDIYLRWYATEKLMGEGRDLYDSRNSQEVDDIVYGQDSGLASGFYYPAHLLIFTAPLARLPYPPAHLLWTTAVQLFYIVAIGALVWFTGWPPTSNQKTVFMLLVLLSVPSIQHTIWGQFNTIGIFSLALTFIALVKGRYGLAGALAIGLTFKPQTTALTLAWLILWAVLRRARWRFAVVFALVGGVMWLFAEWMQPGWVFAFWGALVDYLPSQSVLDWFWNPYQAVALALVLGTVALFVWRGQAEPGSAVFAGCLGLSTAVWSLALPVVGMFHVLVLPLNVILIMPFYRRSMPAWYRRNLIILGAIYVLGWASFLVGLTGIVPYGQHILWSEFTYKALLPLAVGGMSLPLCLSSQFKDVQTAA